MGRTMIPIRRMLALMVMLCLLGACSPGSGAANQRGVGLAEKASATSAAGNRPGERRVGTVNFPISCPRAQDEFNRGVALLHSFWFAPAIDAFQRVVDLNPTCGMGHWGVAMSLLGNPFTWPLAGQPLRDGWAAVQRGTAAPVHTPRERAYLEAIGAFYRDAETVDHQTRAQAYTEQMARLVAEYPEDSEAKVFYALALIATAPPADKTHAQQLKGADVLEEISARQPDHPGVAHYLIHAYDSSALAARGERAARRYAEIAPAVPHALHMPTHIFTRLGLWQASIDLNRASADSAKDELSAAHDQTHGTYDALHAMDYLMYAYLQLGQDDAARAILDRVNGLGELHVQSFPAAYALAAIPARWALERAQWAEAMALATPAAHVEWARWPQAEAVSVFASGLGAARHGDVPAAQAHLERLTTLRDNLLRAKQDYWAGQTDIQRSTVAAWVELAQGSREPALALMRAAADQEAGTEKHPVTPGPVVPARELLGEMLLTLGQPRQALVEIEASQQSEPNRFRGLYLAARAAELSSDQDRARRTYKQLLNLAPQSQRPELATARAAVSDHS